MASTQQNVKTVIGGVYRRITNPFGIKRHERAHRYFLRVIAILFGIAGWWYFASIFPAELMPFPGEVVGLVWELIASGVAWIHLEATFRRTILAFLISFPLALAIGLAMGMSNYGEKFFSPWVLVGISIPGVAWAMITVLIFGFNDLAPISAAVLVGFPFKSIFFWRGVKEIDTDLVDMSKAFDVSTPRLIRRMILPDIAPVIFAMFRHTIAVSWKIVLLSEVFASSSGVGYKLLGVYQAYQFEETWAWALLFMIIIIGIEYLIFKPIEKRAFSYRPDTSISVVGR